LDNGRDLRLVGRIDRVDLWARGDAGTVALVYDYKKGAAGAKFDLGSWYHGLSLQTALYTLVLDSTIVAGYLVARCGGAFLVPVEAPAPSRRYGEADQESFERTARGLFDGDLAEALDVDPDPRGSRYYAFSLKQGQPYGREATSSAYRPAEYQRLLQHTRHLIRDLGQRIAGGEITIAPYNLGSESACTFCDYAAVCKFDGQITPPRLLAKLGRMDVLRALEETDD
jgi:ATP-dependent helicase/nuclease subunit B